MYKFTGNFSAWGSKDRMPKRTRIAILHEHHDGSFEVLIAEDAIITEWPMSLGIGQRGPTRSSTEFHPTFHTAKPATGDEQKEIPDKAEGSLLTLGGVSYRMLPP